MRTAILGVVAVCFLGMPAFGAPRQYNISGFVQTSGSIGVEGVSVVGNNGADSDVTDANGAYSVTVPNNWSGTITVSKAGWLITPAFKTYIDIREDIANENYLAFQPTISGYTGLEGVTIIASGVGSTISNSSYYYSITVPYGWSGTMTASLTGYNFPESPRTYSNVTADILNQNFTPYQPKISGYIRKTDGTSLIGATITASNGGGSDITDANGYYEITVPYDWSGTVSASLAGYGFTDKSYSNVTTDQVNQDFTGYQPKISGYVRKSDGTALSEVSITSTNGGGNTTTNASGYYEIIVPYGWSGTISASLVGYGFNPRIYTNVTIDRINQNFTGFQPKISGYVRKVDGTAISGVFIDANNGGPSSTTNTSGYYEIIVPYDWSGTVSASLADYNFTSKSYLNVTTNRVNQNFIGYQPKISGYVRKADGTALSDATISASGGALTTTNTSGYYEIIVPYGWSGTVTAEKFKWEITPANYFYDNLSEDRLEQNFTANYVGIIVKSDGTGDYPTIQSAIDAAIARDIVILQVGTYIGSGNRDIDFKDKAITVRGATGDPNDCIIDCQADSNNLHRGFNFVSGEDSNSILEAITIANGYGPEEYVNNHWRSSAGAIYCKNSSPSIKKCIISNNYATTFGGGIFIYDGNPTISNCNINNNSSGSLGGGILDYKNSSPRIKDCIINNNSAGFGGGISNIEYCCPEISNCIINNNSASLYGGGIANDALSDALIKNCIISNNTAGDYGGGIYNRGSSDPIISICAIIDNTSERDGGGIYNDLSSPNIINCFIFNNFARGNGGGIDNFSQSHSNITNCTIVYNISSNFWSGGVSNSSPSSTIIANNCIIWDNQPLQIAGNITINYSNIQGGYIGMGNIDLAPCFSGPDANDFHLTGISPCINAGDPNYTPDMNETDIDDEPRIIGTRVDMGADEFAYIGDFNYDGRENFIDYSVLGAAWYSDQNDYNWDQDCDISEPNDGVIDEKDLRVFSEGWLEGV